MISVVTPWLGHPELIADYENAVTGADVVIVDNGSEPDDAAQLLDMISRIGGTYIRNESNTWFAAANNQGLRAAQGDVVLFLNNDIAAETGWLEAVARDCEAGLLCGPSLLCQNVAGRALPYLEGWCIGARREVWDALNGWDAEAYPLPYWEDNDLCWRAVQAGYRLRRCDWPVTHKSNTTSRHTEGAYSHSERNRSTFEKRVLGAAQA